MPIETKDAPAVSDSAYPPIDEPVEEPDVVVEQEVVEEVAAALPAVVTEEERALAERARALAPNTTLPSPGEWTAMLAIVGQVASTQFVPKALRGKPEAVLASIMFGRELGLAPMQSLQKVHMIDGRPGLSADLMLAMMRKGGVQILESESTRERAWIRARRGDGEIAEVEWTIEDARIAGLLGKDNWRQYPADMLWARCVGRLARRLGSDLVGGMVYSAEEMADWDDGEGYVGSVSRSTGQAAPAFDPAAKLTENAPREGWGEVMQMLAYVDPSLDWPLILQDACRAVYGVGSIAELSENDKQAFGRRSANAAGELRANMNGDFPPDDDQIVRILGWAFDGNALTLHRKAVSAPETQEEGEATNSPQEPLDGADGAADAVSEAETADPVDVVDEDELPGFGEEG